MCNSGRLTGVTKTRIIDGMNIISACQICAARPLQLVLALGHHAMVQEYLTEKTRHQPEATYPLNLVRCVRCGLLQLDYVADPTVVFPPSYPYRTGLTGMLIRNFQGLADMVTSQYPPTGRALVVDIGSNDGTLLKSFKKKGWRVLGVEPTNAAREANRAGVNTLQEYFSAASVKKIRKQYGLAKIVTATNVFAHIPDVSSLLRNIKAIMTPDGVFISESQYLLDIIVKLEFDTIYHEHLRFYSLQPLRRLFARHGMSMVDAERISAAGGSIRVFAKKGKHAMSARANQLLAAEKRAGLYDGKTLKKFAERAVRAKHDLLSLLIRCKKNGGRIAAIGSPARSNTLLNFTRVDSDLISYAGEKSGSPKIGLFAPGSHIPVVDEKRLFIDQPDYALLLSWHIGAELSGILRKRGFQGKYILPLPKPKIIS